MATKMVRVVATARGHDGLAVREPGDEFDMPESMFDRRAKKDEKGKDTEVFYEAPSWFKKVADKPTAAPSTRGSKDASDLA